MRTTPLLLLTLFLSASHLYATPAEQVAGLVKLLDDDVFDIRQKAEADLRKLGSAVVPLMEKEMEQTESLEVRWRLGRILEAVGGCERKVRLYLLQLGDDSFTRRAEADQELRKLGKKALPAMKKAATTVTEEETKRRLAKIIQDLSK